jgi:maltose alpha-D-glucosyltransferase/alpha-amylase
LSERRIKSTPLRDVVNMVRSFHYAAHKALANEQERGHFLATRAAEAEQWVRFWSRWISALYLRGYFDSMSSASLLPKEASHLEILFNVLLLDRTLIELSHELANRPDSVHIPLRGLNDLLGSP